MNRLFVIDTENVHDYIFLKALNLTSKDLVVFVCSRNTPNISAGNLEPILKMKCKKDFVKTTVTDKNYMDFVIVSVITEYCCSDNKPESCCVVSNDKGYTSVLKYLGDKFGVMTSRLPINGLFLDKKDPKVKKIFDSFNLSNGEISTVYNCLSVSRDLETLQKSMNDKLGNRGNLVFEKIAPFIPINVLNC